MNQDSYILNTALPLSQDFKALKEEGLSYIQLISGDVWTNLNASDPGVTILDQIIFALTELGYCTDFPIADILTNQQGELELSDQFYLPDEILTTAPLTRDDYRKYIIDRIPQVKNAVIVPVDSSSAAVNGSYQVYLYIDPAVQQPTAIQEICAATDHELINSRNLGELMLPSQALQSISYQVKAQIHLSSERKLRQLLKQIQDQVNTFIFPQVRQEGYSLLKEEGWETDEIFNGPILEHGWIPKEKLGSKKDTIQAHELSDLLLALSDITAVDGLTFISASGTSQHQPIQVKIDQLIYLDIWGSYQADMLQIYYHGKKLEHITENSLNELSNRILKGQIPQVSAVQMTPLLPTGKYREIDQYYSIQHTFPSIYPVGESAVDAHAPNWKVAQSRQLRGYLTLFDQVLANQFSQLAHVGNLLSFRNPDTAAPTDATEYWLSQDKLQQGTSAYPVPFASFSPTYFFQSLYDIPYIKGLLKDSEAFNFSYELVTEQELAHQDWKAYQADTYNSYFRGLMYAMENRENDLERRDFILDHLLARHGESPVLISAIIDGSVYAGDPRQDQLIFKSLYLQNFAILSYFRQKAWNYLAAEEIPAQLTAVNPKWVQQLSQGYTKDFVFQSERVSQIEKLEAVDFSNYSALELKLNLLFGLRVLYEDFIVESCADSSSDQEESTDASKEAEIAQWMIKARKGSILIENAILLHQKESQNLDVASDQMEETTLSLILPDFICPPNFQNRLQLFLKHTLAVHTSCACYIVGTADMLELIPNFAYWHNELIYHGSSSLPRPAPTDEHKLALIQWLNDHKPQFYG